MSLANSVAKRCYSSFLLQVSQAGKCQLMSSPEYVLQPTWASSCSKHFAQSHQSYNNLRWNGREWYLELTWKYEIRLKSWLLQAVLPAALSPGESAGNSQWLHTRIWDPGHQILQMSQSSGKIYEANAKKWAQTETNLENVRADCQLQIQAEGIQVTESKSLSPSHRKLCSWLYHFSIDLSQALQCLDSGIPRATVWHHKFVVLLLQILFTSL